MNQTICSRCGEIFDTPQPLTRVGSRAGHTSVQDVNVDGNLCPGCYESFVKWVNGGDCQLVTIQVNVDS